jgi:hypothetical protein
VRFPSLLRSLDAISDERPDKIVLSTPGPVGLTGFLAARLLGAVESWDHPAYFDYVDPWCAEEGDKAASGIVKAMWQAYRPSADEIGTTVRNKRTGVRNP